METSIETSVETSTETSIGLLLPFKAEYVSAARLVASAVANRLGFNIEDIEDIKVAVSEVCNKLVQMGSQTVKQYKITFNVTESNLAIVYDCEDKSLKCIFSNETDGLAIPIINALMDNVELCTTDDYILSMSKKITPPVF